MMLEFVEIADDVSRDEVLAPASAGKHTEAAVLILEMLTKGRQLSAKVKAAGIAQGLSERTIKRAAAELGIVVEEESTSTGRVTYWSLPEGWGEPLVPKRGPIPLTSMDSAVPRVGPYGYGWGAARPRAPRVRAPRGRTQGNAARGGARLPGLRLLSPRG